MNKKLIFILLSVSALGSLAHAYELIMPARQVEDPDVGIVWYQSQQDLDLQLKSNDRISVGSFHYVNAVTNDFTVSTVNSGMQAKILFQPHKELVYWLSFGSTAYDIDIPSTSVKNHLASQQPGWMAGAGIRKILMPDTIVTPAFAIEAGVRYSQSSLTVLYPGDFTPISVQNDFLTTEYHLGFVASKKYESIEPYGSVQVTRTFATLRDINAADEISGEKDAVSVVTGVRLYPYPNESLICEASFFGENGFSIGWNIEF
ncbi:MAG: hypothetical protein ABSH12_00210 [Endomicrobiales bacterium]|jgi:hypothetical protein